MYWYLAAILWYQINKTVLSQSTEYKWKFSLQMCYIHQINAYWKELLGKLRIYPLTISNSSFLLYPTVPSYYIQQSPYTTSNSPPFTIPNSPFFTIPNSPFHYTQQSPFTIFNSPLSLYPTAPFTISNSPLALR